MGEKLTLFFDSEVHNCGLGRYLWSVVRVTQFRCNVETEFRAVLDFFVAKPNQQPTT